MNNISGELIPRPYARLLSMLSAQLIKNDTIALTELAKNSYDADAEWVQIRIGNIANMGKKGLTEDEKPFVEIEDDGEGMSLEIIKESWMNPASPNKYIRRLAKDFKTKKRRIFQGEKGIGRYAVFQIGKKVEIYSRYKTGENKGMEEVYLVTDLTKFTDELLSHKSSEPSSEPAYLDQIKSNYIIRKEPLKIKPGFLTIGGNKVKRKNHGTLIRISELNYQWSENSAKKIMKVLSRLQSPFRKKDFAISLVLEEQEIFIFDEFTLKGVFNEALLEITGTVDNNGNCKYNLIGSSKGANDTGKIDLVQYIKTDSVLANRTYFDSSKGNGHFRIPECGPFEFKFYAYDLRSMNTDINDFIRSHRIYIYRDDIRVYPYGDADNDWLKLDIFRGITRAGFYFSNDQIIGYVKISSEHNEKLKDKTSREGLLEQGTAYDDLRMLNLSILNFLHVEYQIIIRKSQIMPKNRKQRVDKLYLQTEKVEKGLKTIDNYFRKQKDESGSKYLALLKDNYFTERNIYREQVALVEDLAGVGIAVDATSHDIMIIMERGIETINSISKIARTRNPDIEKLKDKADALQGQINYMNSLLHGIQPIFRSARRKKRELSLINIIKTVKRYYELPISKNSIELEIQEIGPPLKIKSSEGILLQLFINLIDNSIFWLNTNQSEDRKICIIINGDNGSVVFADNGPGVEKRYIDYIFEPFFSTKGMHGRGLGLYIARKLTDKYDYDLYYIEKKTNQVLSGANFRIDFIEQGD